MIPSLLTPKGYRRYCEVVDGIPGLVACWPLNELSGATSVDRIGGYNGTNSGATYYNQVTVTGTLDPDATGTYTAAGINEGLPYYQRGSDSSFIWNGGVARSYNWYMNNAFNVISNPRWVKGLGSVAGTFVPDGSVPPTGTPTVANVTESGVYGWFPSGLTYANAGPLVNGEVVRAMGFDGASGFVTLPSIEITTNGSVSFWAFIIKGAFNISVRDNTEAGGCIPILLSAGSDITGRWNGTNYTLSGFASNTYFSAWTHCAISKAGGGVSVYLNSVLAGEASGISNAATKMPWNIGKNGTNAQYCNCKVIDVRQYNRALTATEVQQLYYGATIGV